MELVHGPPPLHDALPDIVLHRPPVSRHSSLCALEASLLEVLDENGVGHWVRLGVVQGGTNQLVDVGQVVPYLAVQQAAGLHDVMLSGMLEDLRAGGQRRVPLAQSFLRVVHAQGIQEQELCLHAVHAKHEVRQRVPVSVHAAADGGELDRRDVGQGILLEHVGVQHRKKSFFLPTQSDHFLYALGLERLQLFQTLRPHKHNLLFGISKKLFQSEKKYTLVINAYAI